MICLSEVRREIKGWVRAFQLAKFIENASTADLANTFFPVSKWETPLQSYGMSFIQLLPQKILKKDYLFNWL